MATPTITAPTRPATGSRVGVSLLTLAAAAAVGLVLPNRIVEPMDGMTHYMGLVGPGNPGHPWTLLFGMAGMIVAYAGPVAALCGVYPARLTDRAATLGVGALALVTVALAAYLTRYLLLPAATGRLELHGTVDTLSLIFLLLTPIPIAAAAITAAATGQLETRWVWIGAVLLHLGTMIFGMADTGLLGGADAHGHVEAVAMVRWG